MSKSKIIKATESYVEEFFKKDELRKLLFHNINHTRQVVEYANTLAENTGLEEEDLEVLLLAAWFHDIGYVSKRKGHEELGARMANEFLSAEKHPSDKINKIEKLIESTEQSHKPEGILEEILHDADLSHLGSKGFFRVGELLRAELESEEDQHFSELEWQKKQYHFLVNNPFLTKASAKEFGKRKAKNIKKQRDAINDAKKITRRAKTGKDFGRGIDTLYRSSYRSHINFSSIADGKANMMISINTILISVIVTLSGASLSVFKGFQVEHLRYTVPILILLVSSLISVVFAVMSARPKVTENKVSKAAVKRNDMSLLYFGNFLEVSQKEFTNYLAQLKNDQKALYDSMSMDIYNLGIVLKEKYRLLSISYTVFMIGLSLCVIGFIGIFILTNYS